MVGKQVELEIIEVWGTIDGEKAYPYVNIYDTEEEARKEVGTKQDGLEIVDVLKGWFITGTEDFVDTISNDFYWTKEEANEDLDNRIIPSHKALGFEVLVKEAVKVIQVLERPLTIEEIMKEKDKNNFVEGIIAVPLGMIISADNEGFLDIISEQLVGGSLWSIGYSIVGHQDSETLLLQVRGEVTPLLEDINEDK